MNHPLITTTGVSALLVAGTVAVARSRVRYWKQWGLALFDNFADSMTDRLDVPIDLDELTA